MQSQPPTSGLATDRDVGLATDRDVTATLVWQRTDATNKACASARPSAEVVADWQRTARVLDFFGGILTVSVGARKEDVFVLLAQLRAPSAEIVADFGRGGGSVGQARRDARAREPTSARYHFLVTRGRGARLEQSPRPRPWSSAFGLATGLGLAADRGWLLAPE